MGTKSWLNLFFRWVNFSVSFKNKIERVKGKWQLYEYYADTEEGLLHFDEAELIKTNKLLVLSFLGNNDILLAGKFPVQYCQDFEEGKWKVTRNFIALTDSKNHKNNIEFQFAFEKGNLKLLNKTKEGRIQFFGFFRKQN